MITEPCCKKRPVFVRNILFTVMMIFISASGCGRKQSFLASRLQFPVGKFSYITPEGWLRTKLAGIDFTIVSTEASGGIKPNIFVESVELIQIETATSEFIEKCKKGKGAYHLKEETPFITDSGLSGVKLTATHENKDHLLLTAFSYLLQDRDRVITVTCTCANSTAVIYEPVFDAVIKSLKSEDL